MLEMRWTMPDWKHLISTIGLTSLLALVLVVPIRSPGSVSDPSRPVCLNNSFAPPPSHSTARLGETSATDAVQKLKALPSENEGEEGADALDEPRVSFLSFRTFRKVPDRRLIAPRSILSLYPLRC